MVLFPNCKINLGLHIIRKRKDGYHDLETVFYPVGLRDAIEMVKHQQPGIRFSASGLAITGNKHDNLCIKAYHLLKQDFPELPPIQLHLHKAIPMGAGLGGGSADGAFMLQLLNEKFSLQLSDEQLIHYALQLGSDCPFFLINKPCFATGRGEQMQEIELNLSAYKFILINPNIHISTAWAFGQLTPKTPAIPIQQVIQQPVATWKDHLKNDFEEPVTRQYPQIRSIKDELYNNGALYASMTGSGSTVFGIFNKTQVFTHALDPSYFVQEI